MNVYLHRGCFEKNRCAFSNTNYFILYYCIYNIFLTLQIIKFSNYLIKCRIMKYFFILRKKTVYVQQGLFCRLVKNSNNKKKRDCMPIQKTVMIYHKITLQTALTLQKFILFGKVTHIGQIHLFL